LGYPHRSFGFDEPIPAGARVVLVQGPYGTLLPLVRRLAATPREERPLLAYWFQQSLDLWSPESLRLRAARLFSDLHRNHREAGWVARALDRTAPRVVRSRGRRLAFLGDILWLKDRGMLDTLAVSSTVYRDYLASFGLNPLLVARGYHPDYGRALGLKRDIAVVWMGKTRNRRRKRAVYWLRDQQVRRGLSMRIFDGEESPFIFGDDRTRVLNRARFVVNVYAHPAHELSIRFYIAAANGAAVLTEPGQNRYPFVPGTHLVQCPIGEMPDKVMYYLEHEEERRSIAEQMLNVMKTDLTLEQSIDTIMCHAEGKLLVSDCGRVQGHPASEGPGSVV